MLHFVFRFLVVSIARSGGRWAHTLRVVVLRCWFNYLWGVQSPLGYIWQPIVAFWIKQDLRKHTALLHSIVRHIPRIVLIAQGRDDLTLSYTLILCLCWQFSQSFLLFLYDMLGWIMSLLQIDLKRVGNLPGKHVADADLAWTLNDAWEVSVRRVLVVDVVLVLIPSAHEMVLRAGINILIVISVLILHFLALILLSFFFDLPLLLDQVVSMKLTLNANTHHLLCLFWVWVGVGVGGLFFE